MRIFFAILSLALVVTGCVTKSQADAQARAAYIAGQETAYKSMGAQTDVVVIGDVQKHEVPWVEGLTLAQAIATANYNGLHDPEAIIVRRDGVDSPVDPKILLNGNDAVLQAGDIITIVGQ